MDFLRVMDVLVICIPVFAVMGLGKVLARKDVLTDDRCSFINWLVFHFSLPALIFNEVAQQKFDSFFEPALIVMPILALVSLILVTVVIARFRNFRGGFAAAFVFGTFWANATYIGLPLSLNAFGSEGLAKAAIYNAFVVPFFIIFGYLLIGYYGAGTGDVKISARIRKACMNPVLISAVAGIAVALIAECFRGPEQELALPSAVTSSIVLIGSFLKMIGAMGLPLALLSIGASLKWEQARSHLGALSWTIGCKLVLLPLLTLILIRIFCPEASAATLGVTVILAATPSAVASYVVSCQLGVEKGFVSSMLVLSTGLSIFTIPIWVYIVKGFGG